MSPACSCEIRVSLSSWSSSLSEESLDDVRDRLVDWLRFTSRQRFCQTGYDSVFELSIARDRRIVMMLSADLHAGGGYRTHHHGPRDPGGVWMLILVIVLIVWLINGGLYV